MDPNSTPATPDGRFFTAARRFLDAAPWSVLCDEMPLALDGADRQEACLVVLGERDATRGLMLFESIDDYLDFLESVDEGAGPVGPLLHFAFVPRAEAAEPMRQAAEAAGWTQPALVPALLALDAESEGRELGEQDYLVAAACAEAVCDLLVEVKVRAEDEEVVCRSSHEGLPPVELTLPHPAFGGAEDEFIDGFLDEVVERGASPTLAETVVVHALRFKEEAQADALVWSAAEVESFLLLFVPREVAAGADELAEIPAVFGWLLEHIGSGYETMDARRVGRLVDHVEELLGRYKLAIADAGRWSPEKRVAMRMRELGLDPDDEEAAERIAAEVVAEGKPVLRAEAKPGRNDPCPCGSGKKHKKCCGV